jgi:hypothetical protein
MPAPLAETAFAFDGHEVATGEVLLAAVGWGEWADLVRQVERGLACEGRLDGALVAEGELRPGLVAWRRERRLLSAEEYSAWLADRGVTVEAMSAYLRRGLARERAGEGSARVGGTDLTRADALDPAAVAAAVFPEAILSGRLKSWAERLVAQSAAARALHALGVQAREPPVADRQELVAAALGAGASGLSDVPVRRLHEWAARVLALDAAAAELAEHVADEARIERCLSAHGLDWQRLVWEEATFAREDAAREAALWVREEGMALDAIADQAGVPCTVCEAYGSDAGELATLLIGTSEGQLLGPLSTASGWRLVRLRERVQPSAVDRALLARARDELIDDTLAPHLAGRVQWHAQL